MIKELLLATMLAIALQMPTVPKDIVPSSFATGVCSIEHSAFHILVVYYRGTSVQDRDEMYLEDGTLFAVSLWKKDHTLDRIYVKEANGAVKSYTTIEAVIAESGQPCDIARQHRLKNAI